MRIVLSIVLSLFLVGCSSKSVEKVGQDIVNSLNNKNYDKLWDKYIDEDTKKEMKNDLDEVMNDEAVGALIWLSMMGVPEDKFETLTPKELFGYMMNFVNPVRVLKSNTESYFIYDGIDLIDENTAVILVEKDMNEDEPSRLKLVKINDRWYLDMGDNKPEIVEEIEIDETVEDTEVK